MVAFRLPHALHLTDFPFAAESFLKNCDTYLDADGSAEKAADMKMPTNSLISKQWRDLKAMA
jgi:hypothetical protein